MRNKLSIFAIALSGLFALAGCGQKGPLFLPGDPSEIQTEIPRQVPATEDEDDEEENLDR